MMPIKDGVAWTALEYLAYLEEHHGGANVGGKAAGHKPAVVVPVGLTYSDKTKYRSRVAIECVCPLSLLLARRVHSLLTPGAPSQVRQAHHDGRVRRRVPLWQGGRAQERGQAPDQAHRGRHEAPDHQLCGLVRPAVRVCCQRGTHADWLGRPPRRDTLNAANMATQLLWADEKELRMENYKEVVQT